MSDVTYSQEQVEHFLASVIVAVIAVQFGLGLLWWIVRPGLVWVAESLHDRIKGGKDAE